MGKEDECRAWDDVNGGELGVRHVKAARREEVCYLKKREIWVEKPVEECWQKTGKVESALMPILSRVGVIN